ncbi:MAG: 50S ribosomal protein L19e [Candidatus Pacearchaeota archaeon]
MNLSKKKELAKRTFNVGKERIAFVESRLDEIKEAITKQDMRDLKKDGAIVVKEIKGRKKTRAKRKRSTGNIRKKVNKRKTEYMALTRKLRKYVAEMKKQKELSGEDVKDIRKKIRNRLFRSKAHLKTYIGDLKK